MAENQLVGAEHERELVLVFFEPALRTEGLCVGAVDVGAVVHCKRGISNTCASRQEDVFAFDFDGVALGWNVSREDVCDGWPDSHGFTDSGLEIWELLCLAVSDEVILRSFANSNGFVDFPLEPCVYARVCDDVKQGASDASCCGLGAGNNLL